jgi:hypothetical protein
MPARWRAAPASGAVAVIGAHVAVNIQKPHEMPALIDPQTRKLRAQLLRAMVRREAGEPAPQGLDFRRPVEPEEPAERGRVSFLEMLGPLDA